MCATTISSFLFEKILLIMAFLSVIVVLKTIARCVKNESDISSSWTSTEKLSVYQFYYQMLHLVCYVMLTTDDGGTDADTEPWYLDAAA